MSDPAAPNSPVSWSIEVRQVGTPTPLIERQSDRMLRTASVGKLFLLAETARQLELGTTAEHEQLSRNSVPMVRDSGLWHALDVEVLSVDDTARLIAAVSDNLATNVLLSRIGLSAAQELAARHCPGGSQLFDSVRDQRLAHHPETLSRGSASDLTQFFESLALGKVENTAVSKRVLSWLTLSTDHSMVASAFGLDPLSHGQNADGSSPRLWNKTGTDDGVRADVGLIQTDKGRFAYAAIANWEPIARGSHLPVLHEMRSLGEELVRLLV